MGTRAWCVSWRRNDRLEHIAPDVLEVDVDAVGYRGSEAFRERRRLVVEAGVETEFVHAEGALRQQGYDPGAIDDPVYVRHDAGGTYVRVRDAADASVR